jgi:hypothetical protein
MKIDFIAGCDIEGAWNELQKLAKYYGIACYGDFNGKTIYSNESLDEAYIKIIGKSKTEHDKVLKKHQQKYEREKQKHEKAIPKLTKTWIKKGKAILASEYHKKWEECVPIRLGDLYRGMELGHTLEIIKIFNDYSDAKIRYAEAKKKFDEHGHSGMSGDLVLYMLKAFHPYGEKFRERVLKNK